MRYPGEYAVNDFLPWVSPWRKWSITDSLVRESDFRSVPIEKGISCFFPDERSESEG
jgi:hypothetical protein